MNQSSTKNELLKISGLDAKKFLQGQLTCNMDEINSLRSQLAAHCNPQGRIISLFTLFTNNADYYLLLPEKMAAIAMAALKKYSAFYKVTLEIIPIDTMNLPQYIILDKHPNLMAGIPAIYPETSGQFLPHELNLQQLNALSFNKGCYTGQEIIARMHYRGKLKKHLYRAIIHCDSAPIPGEEVYFKAGSEQIQAGTIVDSTAEISDNSLQSSYLTLLICHEDDAINQHLFIRQNDQTYLTFLD